MKRQTKLISILLLLTGSLFAVESCGKLETDATPNKWVDAAGSVVIEGTASSENGCAITDYKWRINSAEGNNWLTADARYDGTGTIKFIPADMGYVAGDVVHFILRTEDSSGQHDSDDMMVTVTGGEEGNTCTDFDVNKIDDMWVRENGSVMTTPTATSDSVTVWRYRIAINDGSYTTVQEGADANFKFIPADHGAVAGDDVKVVVRAVNDGCDDEPHDSEDYVIHVVADDSDDA